MCSLSSIYRLAAARCRFEFIIIHVCALRWSLFFCFVIVCSMALPGPCLPFVVYVTFSPDDRMFVCDRDLAVSLMFVFVDPSEGFARQLMMVNYGWIPFLFWVMSFHPVSVVMRFWVDVVIFPVMRCRAVRASCDELICHFCLFFSGSCSIWFCCYSGCRAWSISRVSILSPASVR